MNPIDNLKTSFFFLSLVTKMRITEEEERQRVRKEEKNLQHGSVEDAGGGEFKTGKSCE